jgi:dihydroflavonol-4-reductase
MNNQVTIAITGGTGHIGHVLIKMLLEKDFRVTALYRKTLPQLQHPNLLWISGDVTNQTTMDLLVQHANAVIHSAAVISIGNQNKDEVYHINVNGTQTIMNACERFNNRLIYISSSTAVQETSGTAVFDENRPYKTQADFIYEWTKALSEQLILEAVKCRNLDAIIIRPTSVIGPPDYRPSYFGEAIKNLGSHKFPVMVSGGYNLVDVRDISTTVINSIDKGVSGEIYLAGGTYLSLKQIAEIANPGLKYVVLPLNLLLSLLPVIKIYQRIFPIKWPVTKESLVTLKRAPKIVDSSKAIHHLNHQIRPVSDTVRDLLEWFKAGNG